MFKKRLLRHLTSLNTQIRPTCHAAFMSKISKQHGYPVEQHTVVTSDAYILNIFRIPGSSKSAPAPQKPVAFLQHGLLSSSADYVVLGKDRALALLLADAGFDVWLGNARGNKFSLGHKWLSTDSNKFWEFSWHEIGLFDLPAMIDYVLATTKQPTLHYIGHSQGSTAFFVMASMETSYNDKVKTMQAMAPAVFMSNAKAPYLKAFSPINDSLEWILDKADIKKYPDTTRLQKFLTSPKYRDNSLLQQITATVFSLTSGYGSDKINNDLLPAILENFPAGASMRQLHHYSQLVKSERFCRFNYGLVKNLEEYGTSEPPDYALCNVTAPTFIHYSDNDWLVAVQDVDKLSEQLGNVVMKRKVSYNLWNHLDFLYAADAKDFVYNEIIRLMREHD